MVNPIESLYKYFLKKGYLKKIPRNWAINNIDMVYEYSGEAGVHFFCPGKTIEDIILHEVGKD